MSKAKPASRVGSGRRPSRARPVCRTGCRRHRRTRIGRPSSGQSTRAEERSFASRPHHPDGQHASSQQLPMPPRSSCSVYSRPGCRAHSRRTPVRSDTRATATVGSRTSLSTGIKEQICNIVGLRYYYLERVYRTQRTLILWKEDE